jgi:hypothetical protein
VKHAQAEALARIAPLLAALRRDARLKERGAGKFYLRSSAFLHFHEDPAGLFADLKCDGDWQRFPVNTAAEREQLLASVGEILSA